MRYGRQKAEFFPSLQTSLTPSSPDTRSFQYSNFVRAFTENKLLSNCFRTGPSTPRPKALGLEIPLDAARPRRRGDRISIDFAAVHMSLPGTSRHFAAPQRFGRFRSKAVIERAALTEP